MSLVRPWMLAVPVGLALAAPGCGPDLLLGARDLEIVPNPAQEGQAVSFVFALTVVPAQSFTVVALIDGTEHTSVTGREAVAGPFQVDVGDAGVLIARYGLGAHTAYIEVRLNEADKTARTADVSFELQVATPP